MGARAPCGVQGGLAAAQPPVGERFAERQLFIVRMNSLDPLTSGSGIGAMCAARRRRTRSVILPQNEHTCERKKDIWQSTPNLPLN